MRATLAMEVLDREVASLEPFLEAMPSVCVMTYMIMTDPGFLSSLPGSISFYRAAWPWGAGRPGPGLLGTQHMKAGFLTAMPVPVSPNWL